MAQVIKDGYGQIELNRCSFLHDGNIESQCVATEALENGAIVVIDRAAKTVSKATDFSTGLLGVNYTAERIYNQFTPGRKNFRVEADDYPRVGIVKAGDIFSTNEMLTNGQDLATVEAGLATGMYLQADGSVAATATKFQVVEITDTADGQTALKIQVL